MLKAKPEASRQDYTITLINEIPMALVCSVGVPG